MSRNTGRLVPVVLLLGVVGYGCGVAYDLPESHHPENPYCSGTPATDGGRVVACFGSAGV